MSSLGRSRCAVSGTWLPLWASPHGCDLLSVLLHSFHVLTTNRAKDVFQGDRIHFQPQRSWVVLFPFGEGVCEIDEVTPVPPTMLVRDCLQFLNFKFRESSLLRGL